MYNDMARYIGDALHTCMQQSGTNCKKKPILLGFANLRDVKKHNDIKQRAQLNTNTAEKEVLDRSFDLVRR